MSTLRLKPKISARIYVIFFVFIAIYYGIPFVFHLIMPAKFDFYFNLPDTKIYLLIIPLMILMIWMLDASIARIKINDSIFKLIGKIIGNFWVNLFLSILFLGLALYFISNFSFNFRHKVRLEDAGKLPMLVFTFSSFFRTLIFGTVLRFLTGQKITLRFRIVLFITSICFILTANSSYDIITILVSLCLTFGMEKFLFLGDHKKSLLSFIKGNFKYLLIGVFGFATLFMGVANKYGIETTTELMQTGEFYFLVVRRISMWYVSILGAGFEYFSDISFPIEPNVGLIEDIFRRIGIILGYKMDKPEVWGINRMNHLVVYPAATVHAGSSPGVFASVFYIPFFPVSLFVISFYIIFILRQFSDVLRDMKSGFNIVGFPLMAFFLLPFFESPIEQINFVGKGFIYFFFNLTWLFYIKSSIINNQQTDEKYA